MSCLANPYIVSTAVTSITQGEGCTLNEFTITSNGSITTTGQNGIINPTTGQITTLTNTGSISTTTNSGIDNYGTIISLINNGSITANVFSIFNTGTITNLINNGTIIGNVSGIYNTSNITTFSNSQVTPLTYQFNLPLNYNIIINSTSNYGKIIFSNPSGRLNFGIDTSSTATIGTYTNVIQGLASAAIINKSGIYNGYGFTLVNSSGSI